MSAQRDSPASPSPPPPPRSPLKWLKSPRRSSSPDSSCPICLGDVVNKSVTNTCMHEFCFRCLREWSKIKAECPLCKQRFSKIYHTINSMDEYEEYVLERVESSAGANAVLDPILINFQILTNARIRAPLMLLFPPRDSRNHPSTPASVVTRQRIYDQNLWALPLRSQRSSRRIRESNPQFYRLNPAQSHRLIPWLLRELNILLGSTNADTSAVMTDILEAIQMYPIRSRQFATRMRAYLGHNTPHFVHEFYRFAVAPFDMEVYDMCVEYTSFNNNENVENVSDSDSDVEIVRVQNSTSFRPTLNVPRSNVPFLSSTSTAQHHSHNSISLPGRLLTSALDRSSVLDLTTHRSLLRTLATGSSSPFVLSPEDEVATSSVSTVPPSPELSSSSSTDVIVIPSSPSNYSPASPSTVYSSGSDIEILSPPRRPTPIVITIDDSSEEETKVDVKTESSQAFSFKSSPVDNITSEPVAGPSGTSRRLLSDDYYDPSESPSDSFSNSSSGEEYSVHKTSQLKNKRKIKTKKKRLPPKKRSRRWSTTDDNDSSSSCDDNSRKSRRESRYATKKKKAAPEPTSPSSPS